MMDRDRGILDVPPGAAGSPWARPRRFSGLLGLPQDEVGRVPLPVVQRDARARAMLFDLLAAQPSPTEERRRVVVHASVLSDVGDPFPEKSFDLVDDLCDVLPRARIQ